MSSILSAIEQFPKTQTPQQRANTLYALTMWADIAPEAVYPRLADWIVREDRCGTQACFGGHLARDPYFEQLGVYPDPVGAPRLKGNPEMMSADISESLFGYEHMFVSRGFHPRDIFAERVALTSDHEIVRLRLQYLLDNTEVVPNDNT